MKDNNKTNKMVTHWIHWDVFATASNIRPIVRIDNSRLGEKQERISFFVQLCFVPLVVVGCSISLGCCPSSDFCCPLLRVPFSTSSIHSTAEQVLIDMTRHFGSSDGLVQCTVSLLLDWTRSVGHCVIGSAFSLRHWFRFFIK